jgi:hypothetical protein
MHFLKKNKKYEMEGCVWIEGDIISYYAPKLLSNNTKEKTSYAYTFPRKPLLSKLKNLCCLILVIVLIHNPITVNAASLKKCESSTEERLISALNRLTVSIETSKQEEQKLGPVFGEKGSGVAAAEYLVTLVVFKQPKICESGFVLSTSSMRLLMISIQRELCSYHKRNQDANMLRVPPSA